MRCVKAALRVRRDLSRHGRAGASRPESVPTLPQSRAFACSEVILAIPESFDIESSFDLLLSEEFLRPSYQPIIDLDNGTTVGYEALARWPGLGVTPEQAFAAAARLGRTVKLDRSHTAVIAREYGIPAVLATGEATCRLRDGDLVSVDGTTGIVSIDAQRAGSMNDKGNE